VEGLIVCGQRESRTISHLGEEKDELGVDIGSVSQDGVTVYTSMFEVDTSFAVRTNDDLELP